MATAKQTTEETEFSFAELLPQKGQRSIYPHLKSLSGKKVSIKDLQPEDDAKKSWYVVTSDDAKYSVPPTLAKKIAQALKNARDKGGKSFSCTVTALDRGVRLS